MSALSIMTRLLLDAPAVTALVSTKVRSFSAEQQLAPSYIVLNLAGNTDEQMLEGAGKYYEARVTVEATALTGSLANQIGETVIDAIGSVVKATVYGGGSPTLPIGEDVDVFLAGSDYSDTSDDRSTFRRQIDFTVRWRKP